MVKKFDHQILIRNIDLFLDQDLKLDLDLDLNLSVDRDLDLIWNEVCASKIVPGGFQKGLKATENACWAVLGHPGACRPRPGGALGTSEGPLKPPKSLQALPKECPRAPQGSQRTRQNRPRQPQIGSFWSPKGCWTRLRRFCRNCCVTA